MDIGESLDWIAYATVDGHVRDLCGLKSPAALNVPFYIFDKSNAKDAGVPAGYDTGYGDAYISGFHEVWKLRTSNVNSVDAAQRHCCRTGSGQTAPRFFM